MLTILKMNPIGSKGEQPVIYFEFGFDNPTELPKLAFQIGEDISIVANNSIAVNNKNNVVYKFNGDSWVRTNDKYNSFTKSNTITTNGNYMIANNSIGGFTDINTNVEGELNIGDLSVTANGVYNASDEGLDGFGNVNVNVSGANFTKLITNYGAVKNVYGTYKVATTNVVYLHSNNTIYDIDLNVTGQSACYVLLDPAHDIRLTNVIEGTSTPQITFKPAYNTGSANQTYFYINGDGPIYYDPDRGNMPQYVYTTSFSWDSTPSGYTPVHCTYRWSSGDIIFNMTYYL